MVGEDGRNEGEDSGRSGSGCPDILLTGVYV